MARNIAPQDVSWFLDLSEREKLDLEPPYQRNSVWSTKERKYFLDTVFHGYPCPPLFLYKSISDTGSSTFHVVDGKQRLETIINFADNKIAIPADFDNKDLRGKKFKQLTTEQKKIFWNYQFAVELLDVVDSATVKEIFGRYNRTAKNLEPQELRHAKYDGWFVNFAEAEAIKAEWSRLGISTTAKARRMKDVQFISELMIQVLNNGTIIGFDQLKIEEYYAEYESPSETTSEFSEEDFSKKFENIKEIILALESQYGIINRFAKSYTHFFSLWNLLVSNPIEITNLELLATRYVAFMEKVQEFSQTDNHQELLTGENAPLYNGPFNYYENAKGAATEFPQRQNRHKQLLALLANE